MNTRPCAGECGRETVAEHQWARLSADKRLELRKDGIVGRKNRDTCSRCFNRGKRGYKGRSYTYNWAVVEEWLWMHEAGELCSRDSRQKRIQQAAPRLGMTTDALSKALDRATQRGELAA